MLARSVLQRAFSIELRRNALRVENQNRTWNHLELERHADALGYGLLDLGFRRGDRLVTWFDPKHGTEIITTQYGCLKAGVHLIPVFGTSSEEFVETVKSSGAKGAFFSPNRRVEGNQKASEAILSRFSELKAHHTGNPISIRGLPELRFLVHNGFYTVPGTYKFRVVIMLIKDILFYANRNFLKEQFDLEPHGDSPVIGSGKSLYTLKKIEEAAARTQKLSGDTIAVLGDPNCPRVFSEGIYPAIKSEKYAILFADESESNAAQVLKHIQNPIVVHGKGANERVVENLRGLGISQFLNLTA